MPTVRAFQIPGVRCWFWSHDHLPPHFHAKRSGEWEIRVYFLRAPEEMLELVWAMKEPWGKVLHELTSMAEQHRVALLEQWCELHQE